IDLLRDERHVRVQQAQGAVENLNQRAQRRRSRGGASVAQLNLGDLQVPVAVFAPEEVVDLAACLPELILLDQVGDLRDQAAQTRGDPAVGQRGCLWIGVRQGLA